jgi:hypothetical protein
MLNQGEVNNRVVENAPILPQSCTWETAKGDIDDGVSGQALQQQIAGCNELGSRYEIVHDPITHLADSNSIDEEAGFQIDAHEIITFVINASVRDISKPMPPPRRYVRKDKSQQ